MEKKAHARTYANVYTHMHRYERLTCLFVPACVTQMGLLTPQRSQRQSRTVGQMYANTLVTTKVVWLDNIHSSIRVRHDTIRSTARKRSSFCQSVCLNFVRTGAVDLDTVKASIKNVFRLRMMTQMEESLTDPATIPKRSGAYQIRPMIN